MTAPVSKTDPFGLLHCLMLVSAPGARTASNPYALQATCSCGKYATTNRSAKSAATVRANAIRAWSKHVDAVDFRPYGPMEALTSPAPTSLWEAWKRNKWGRTPVWIRVVATVTAVLMFIAALAGNEPDPAASADGPKLMPDLVGMSSDEAERALEELDLAAQAQAVADLSPLERYPSGDWSVVRTRPAAGKPIGDKEVWVFALQAKEAKWFRNHRRMPSLPNGRPTDRAIQKDFGPVRDLLLYRFPPGEGPESAATGLTNRRPDPTFRGDPRIEPRNERIPRDRLKVTSPYSSLTAGSLPTAGDRLRVGQLLAILATPVPEPEPEPEPATNDGNDSLYLYYDDDDDFNVPGWLCPTRWC